MNAIEKSNPATIRAYFQKVHELNKSGERYPVSLDDVWPLVYAEKGVAIRALKKNFFEGEDFEVFDQNVKNPNGGRPEKGYRLTTACLEHFIARKVREVFEVYRTVFHKVAEQAEQPALTPAELLVQQIAQLAQMAQLTLENDRRISRVEQRLEQVIEIQQEATSNLLALPQPEGPITEMSKSDQVRRIVNQYAAANAMAVKDVWHKLYSELYYRYHVGVSQIKLINGESSKLQALVRLGHLDSLYNLALHLLRVESPKESVLS